MTTEQRAVSRLDQVQDLDIYLEPDEENEVIREVGEETAEQFWESILDAFPEFQLAPLEKAEGWEALWTYLFSTHPVDAIYLREPKWFELLHSQLAPRPMSPFWANLASVGAEPFKFHQAEFKRLLNEKIAPVLKGLPERSRVA